MTTTRGNLELNAWLGDTKDELSEEQYEYLAEAFYAIEDEHEFAEIAESIIEG